MKDIGFQMFLVLVWFVERIQIGYQIEKNLCLLNILCEMAIAGMVGNYLTNSEKLKSASN